jgi:predicted CXXCH cytochrome family protein
MTTVDVFGANLAPSHPVSMKPADDGQLARTLFTNPATTQDPAVLLVAGKVECVTCHDPHVPNNDPVAKKFLVRSNSKGVLCTACHDPSRVQPNQLNGWYTGSHYTNTSTVPTTAAFGAYGNVAANACSNCHAAHNNGAPGRNLRAAEEAACSPCHGGANVTPAISNVMTEFTKTYAHPTTTVTGAHDAAETLPVNSTRHAECADCHNSHTAAAQAGIPVPPTLPASLTGVSGSDSTGAQIPATKEYQMCLKCHGDSTNKPTTSTYGRTSVRYPLGVLPAGLTPPPSRPADPLNLRLKFTSTIGHNVMGNSTVTTSNTTLRPNMLDINNSPIASRPLTTTSLLYCSDCHNNDKARSINGTGPNGAHGSSFLHLLQFNLYQEPAGGGTGNTAAGYALCSKCHNLTNLNNVRPHDPHMRYACTTCHDPHGVINGSAANAKGMMNFDSAIVTAVTVGASSYLGYYNTGATRGCYLTCHGERHNPYTY